MMGRKGCESSCVGWHVVQAKDGLHLAVSMGLFIALDKYLKSVFIAKAIRFPSALFGMLSLFVFLSALSAVNAGKIKPPNPVQF